MREAPERHPRGTQEAAERRTLIIRMGASNKYL